MPPRRGRGRKSTTPSKADQPQEQNESQSSEMDEGTAADAAPSNGVAQADETSIKEEPATAENAETNVEPVSKKEKEPPADDVQYPYQIKLTRLPTSFNTSNLQQYLASTFKIIVPKVTVHDNNALIKIYLTEKEPMERLVRLLDNHVWRKKAIRAEAYLPLESLKRKREEGEEAEDPEKKKLKVEEENVPLSLAEEFLAESMPLMKIPYDEQNRISLQDAELMSARLHAMMCERNKALGGWAEKCCEEYGGTIFPIDAVRTYDSLKGYRNKCKFRIGKNNAGEIIVGFVLNDNDNKILPVEPGDSLIHLPDIMKLAAKKLQDFVRASTLQCYDRRKKTGLWESLRVRIAPDGRLMLVIVVSPRGLDEKTLEKAKMEVTEFFMNGDGKECNVMSLFLHVTSPNAVKDSVNPKHFARRSHASAEQASKKAENRSNVSHANDKMHHLAGDEVIVETICGVKFHVSPLSILNIYPYNLETVYNSVEELAQPTPDSVVIDACAGSCGIAFILSKKCEKAYAIELLQQNIDDAEKSKALNNIENVEIVMGKCEDKIGKVLEDNKEKPMIIILDPPRHGLDSKFISLIRAQPNVKRIVFICCDTNTEIKNLVELAAPEGKDAKSGLEFVGLPFLPLRIIPIDVAPNTVINTLLFVFERVDPSTYPAPTKPIPDPSKYEIKKKVVQPPRRRGRPEISSRRPRGSSSRYSAPPLMRNPIRGPPRRTGGGGGGGGGGPRYVEASVISKYERRIAELEEQQRAYKAGLAMGMQAFRQGAGGGGNTSGGYSDSGSANSSWNSGGANYGSGYSNVWGNNNPAWQQGGQGSPWSNSTGSGWGSNTSSWGGNSGYSDGGWGGSSSNRNSQSPRMSGGSRTSGSGYGGGNTSGGRGGGRGRGAGGNRGMRR